MGCDGSKDSCTFFSKADRSLESSTILVETLLYAYFESELLHWHPYSGDHFQFCAKM